MLTQGWSPHQEKESLLRALSRYHSWSTFHGSMDHWHVSRLRETQFDLKARYDFTSGVDAAGCSKIQTSHPPALGLPSQPLNPEAVFPQ
jgi:hypothetical protein